MFEGTIRSNLDPLEEYKDEQIWEALDKCHLGDEVRKKEGKLDSTVTKNGENWSMGQRQLVCLGRVLLKKRKVLVLDEATASVDTTTDNMIQQTLKQHFFDSTVITIVHRITPVLSSDMILVLEQGLIEEFDSPIKLLENKSSSFAKLVAEYSMRSNSIGELGNQHPVHCNWVIANGGSINITNLHSFSFRRPGSTRDLGNGSMDQVMECVKFE